jgi:hypothetical protein
MAKQFLFIIGFIFSTQVIAQTGIGTTTPHASAKLDVSATNKGFLPPRIALLSITDIATIVSPANGLIIYNTATSGTTPNNVLPGYYYWDGSKWNALVDQGSLNSFSGFVPNYAQSNASSVSTGTTGAIIVSQSITTSGRPIQIIATGDANPPNAAWCQLQLYRDGVAIGKKLQAESSNGNENVPYCLNFIDNPTAGTYTYSVRFVTGSGSFQFGEADGNQITLLELGAWSAGTMPVSKGGTGVTSSTGTGSVVLSNTPTLETPIISSGSSQYPSSIYINPTTHATSRRAAVWTGDWGMLQDFNGDGTKNFSITQNFSNTYPTRFFIDATGNTGIGTSSPAEKLEVNGNVKANNFLGTASSTKLFLLEAHANSNYTLPGSWTNDLCRYSNVNNTVNVSSSWFNTSTYRFTPQKAGYWEITASYDIYRGGETYLQMQKNGIAVAQAGTIYSVNETVKKIIYLNGTTDYITVTNNGGAANSRSQSSFNAWFQARWLGE